MPAAAPSQCENPLVRSRTTFHATHVHMLPKEHKDYSGNCLICFNEFNTAEHEDESAEHGEYIDPCGHVFGSLCLAQHFEMNPREAKCPLCRVDLYGISIREQREVRERNARANAWDRALNRGEDILDGRTSRDEGFLDQLMEKGQMVLQECARRDDNGFTSYDPVFTLRLSQLIDRLAARHVATVAVKVPVHTMRITNGVPSSANQTPVPGSPAMSTLSGDSVVTTINSSQQALLMDNEPSQSIPTNILLDHQRAVLAGTLELKERITGVDAGGPVSTTSTTSTELPVGTVTQLVEQRRDGHEPHDETPQADSRAQRGVGRRGNSTWAKRFGKRRL